MTQFSTMAPERAERVFDLIPDDNDGSQAWITGNDLARRAGMTKPHVYEAVAYIRDLLPDISLVSHPDRGYRFTTNESEIVAYRNWRVRTANTVLSRLWTGALLPFIGHLEPEQAVEIEAHFLALIDGLTHMGQLQTVS